jgi:prefoldin subunit 5
MTEQQQHLQSVIQQGQELAEEINKLNAQVQEKRAMLTKLQGVAEYLDQIGVKLPEEGAEKAAPAPEVVAPTEVVEEGE